MTPAFINGFPIVYSDTSTYIVSGFEWETPFDRPITYGLFLWLTSLGGISLWLTVFAQCLILAWCVRLLNHRFLGKSRRTDVIVFLEAVVLSLLTSSSWVASQLMPDVFTPIMLLSAILIITNHGGYSLGHSLFLYFIFFLSASMHMGHLSFNVAFLVAILIIRKIKVVGLKDTIQLRPVILLMALSVATIFTMGSAFAKSRNGFFMGALVEHGIAKEYLDRHCNQHQYKMCAYKDSLPEYAWEFLWEKNSPFYKMGAWTETREEFGEIIHGTLTSPEFIGLHVKESLKATAQQIVKFKIGDGNGAFLQGTQLHERIALYFPHELSKYEHSSQNRQQLSYTNIANEVLAVVVILAVILLGWLAIKRISGFNNILILILLGILVNAWVCGTFANAIDRLGTKVIWLIPLMAMIGSYKFWQSKPRYS